MRVRKGGVERGIERGIRERRERRAAEEKNKKSLSWIDCLILCVGSYIFLSWLNHLYWQYVVVTYIMCAILLLYKRGFLSLLYFSLIYIVVVAIWIGYMLLGYSYLVTDYILNMYWVRFFTRILRTIGFAVSDHYFR